MSNSKPILISRQVRFKTAYEVSDKSLNDELKQHMGDTPYRLHIYHHSHLLRTHLSNATAYNTKKLNGICLVLLEVGDKFIASGYTLCSPKDTYSRLIGRVEAKDHLMRQLKDPSVESFDFNLSGKQATEPYRYINKLVAKFAPKPVVKKVKNLNLHPLTFHNESDLTLELKQTISKVYGVDSKSIMQHFFYVRRYENRLVRNQYGTYDYIQEQIQSYPDDEIILKSTGGITGGVVSFIKDGNRILLIGTALCSQEDTFVKSLGRKTILKNITRGLTDARVTLPIDAYKVPLDTPYESILQSLPTIIPAQFYEASVNAYVSCP